jgi:hypothetical protein
LGRAYGAHNGKLVGGHTQDPVPALQAPVRAGHAPSTSSVGRLTVCASTPSSSLSRAPARWRCPRLPSPPINSRLATNAGRPSAASAQPAVSTAPSAAATRKAPACLGRRRPEKRAIRTSWKMHTTPQRNAMRTSRMMHTTPQRNAMRTPRMMHTTPRCAMCTQLLYTHKKNAVWPLGVQNHY